MGEARRKLQDTFLKVVFTDDEVKFAHALKISEWEDEEEEDLTVDDPRGCDVRSWAHFISRMFKRREALKYPHE